MSNKSITLDDVAQSIANLGAKVDDQISNLGTKISGLDTKVSGLETKVSGLETKVSNMDEKMDTGFNQVDDRLSKVEQRLTDVETNQRYMGERLEKVEKSTTALHNDIVEIYSMV